MKFMLEYRLEIKVFEKKIRKESILFADAFIVLDVRILLFFKVPPIASNYFASYMIMIYVISFILFIYIIHIISNTI